MKKIFLLFALYLLSFIFYLLSFERRVFAEERISQTALSVSPAILELVLDPGKKKQTEVTVINVTKFPLPVKGTVKNFVVKEEVIGDSEGIFDSSAWIKLEPSDFILQPLEEKKIKVTVAPPKKAEPGGHYATIYFQPLVPVEVLSPQTAFIAARVGILGFLVVRGEIIEKALIERLLVKKFQQFGPIEFKVSMKNEGNTHLIPSGSMTITDFRGQEVGKVSLIPATVLPKTSREFVLNWKKKYLLGKYSVTGEFLYGTEHEKIKTDPVVFWVLPWVPILASFCLLTCLIIFLTMVKGRIFLALKVLLGKAEVWELKRIKFK